MNRAFILACFKIKEETEKFFDYFTNKLDSRISKPLQKLNKTP